MKSITLILILLSTLYFSLSAQIPEQIDPSEDEVKHLSDNPELIWVFILVVGGLAAWYFVARHLKTRK
jgi:hypothetical protein